MSKRTLHRLLSVIRITLNYLFELARGLEPLSRLAEGPISEKTDLYIAETHLTALLHGSVYSAELRSCIHPGVELLKLISDVLDKAVDEDSPNISRTTCGDIRFKYEQFRTVMLSEISVWPSYFVTRKGGYDTLTLLDSGTDLFPDVLGKKVPEALFDAEEACKALAFECCTAAGFHIYRSLECVLRRYWKQVSGGAADPKVRSIGVYVRHLNDNNFGSDKVIAALDQINKLDRNPLIHPEVVLNMDETITVLGIVRSAMSRMLDALPDVPPTTTQP